MINITNINNAAEHDAIKYNYKCIIFLKNALFLLAALSADFFICKKKHT